jgi:hypothetical protein
MNTFQIDMAFKNKKNDVWYLKKVAFTSKVMQIWQLMDYMVSLHFSQFKSWGVLDNGPLYCITLWDEYICHYTHVKKDVSNS